MKHAAHKGRQRSRQLNIEKTANAKDAIGALHKNCEIYILTFGQFSLMDAICECLTQTGPADVVIATWTAANADLRRTKKQVQGASILSLRFIVDRSFATRQPAYCDTMRALFGDRCIRTTRSHAKFVLIQNKNWNLVLRTSMNLNENPRLENLEISDDPELAMFMRKIADDLFTEVEEGNFKQGIPLLDGIPSKHKPYSIKTGTVSVGRLK